MCGTYKFWFSQITNNMISMESNNGKIPYSQNFRLRETCWQALFGNTQTATVSVCCEWKSQGKGSVSSSGECDHHASREKLRAQQLSVLAALLTLRLTAITPPCQQSLVPGALTGGDHMLLSPSCKGPGKRRQLQPFNHIVSWCSEFDWWRHSPAESVMISTVLCRTASAGFP